VFAAVRYFVTGTDTDVGKTRLTGGLARALVARGAAPTIVKLVQTGVEPGEPGDAARAARLAGCEAIEFERYARPADPWSAALAENRSPPTAAALATRLALVRGAVVVEGAGGIAVPLNATETFADVVVASGLRPVLAVGLRLGCISHAILTVAFLRARSVAIDAAVLIARFEPVPGDYERDVRRALADHVRVLGTVPFEPDEAVSVEYVATLMAKEGL
jgi:dethiobiotin synthase